MSFTFEDKLRAVLDRSTEAVGTPGLTAVVIREAGRRRARRRGAAAVVLAVGFVSAIFVVVEASDDSGDVTPPPTTSTPPTSTTNPTGPPSEPTSSPATERQLVEGTQPKWDPRRVDDLPAAGAGVAAFLPDLVEPPTSSTPLSADPIEAAVLAVEDDRTGHLLSTSGEWRSVPLNGEYPGLSLSPAGTRLLEYHYADGPGDEVTLHDLASGTSRRFPYPSDYKPQEFAMWDWIDEQTLFLDDWRRGWLIDASSGTSHKLRYPNHYWAIAADGSFVETSDFTSPAEFTDWRGGTPRVIPESATGRLLSLQADAETVVGTSYDERPFSVLLSDRDTLTPQYVLPLVDHEANYSNGGLSVLALMDDKTVLLRVAVFGETPGLRVVRWEPATGDLSLVTAVRTPTENAAVTFASGLLRRSEP